MEHADMESKSRDLVPTMLLDSMASVPQSKGTHKYDEK